MTLGVGIFVDIFMNKLSREDIASLFSKKELKTLKYPILEEIDWENLDFLGWIHPSGHIGYMVCQFEKQLRGFVLNRVPNYNDKVGMCSICKTIHNNTNVSFFSTQSKQNKDVTIGDFVCRDLQCSLYIRGKIPNPIVQMWENLDREDKITRLRSGLDKFCKKIVYNTSSV